MKSNKPKHSNAWTREQIVRIKHAKAIIIMALREPRGFCAAFFDPKTNEFIKITEPMFKKAKDAMIFGNNSLDAMRAMTVEQIEIADMVATRELEVGRELTDKEIASFLMEKTGKTISEISNGISKEAASAIDRAMEPFDSGRAEFKEEGDY